MRLRLLLPSCAAAGLVFAACDDTSNVPADGGAPGADATVPDAGAPSDAATEDANAPSDAGAEQDASAPEDAGDDAQPTGPGCGDGIVNGDESCDVGADASADDQQACIGCMLQPGWVCPEGEACRPTVCGDGVQEGLEQCEDDNLRSGDGCSQTCMLEPLCTGGTCVARCGDGVLDEGEACDDGNFRAGDGCSPTCTVEPGWRCEAEVPSVTRLPILYRDFRGHDLPAAGDVPRGHLDFESRIGAELGIVQDLLGEDGLPVYAKTGTVSLTTWGKAEFDMWYRSVPGYNLTVPGEVDVSREANTDQVNYPEFFPLDDAGWVALGHEPLRSDPEGGQHNFSFTSELHAWFRYSGTEVLTFVGDDDVWIFINRHRALDLGGVHQPTSGTVLMSQREEALGLEVGKVYEIAVFHAERHTFGSSYRLTLPTPPDRSVCQRAASAE